MCLEYLHIFANKKVFCEASNRKRFTKHTKKTIFAPKIRFQE